MICPVFCLLAASISALPHLGSYSASRFPVDRVSVSVLSSTRMNFRIRIGGRIVFSGDNIPYVSVPADGYEQIVLDRSALHAAINRTMQDMEIRAAIGLISYHNVRVHYYPAGRTGFGHPSIWIRVTDNRNQSILSIQTVRDY